MSLNNDPDNNFEEESFSEDIENFDTQAIPVATESTKSKKGWVLFLLVIGVAGYIGYRYYLTRGMNTLPALETVPSIPTVAETKPSPPKGDKNAQFDQLKKQLFTNNAPPTPTVTPAPTNTTTVPIVATTGPTTVTPIAKPTVPVTAPTPVSATSVATEHMTQLNERLEANIQHIQQLEEALQGITQTIARLNSDVNAIDSRLSTMNHSTAMLSSDMGVMKQDISSVKRVLGEEGILDSQLPPPPSHLYTKASQLARAQAAPPAYVVHAIIPGRAWLKSRHGQITTVTEGDTLGDYGKVLVIDAASGMVLTSSGNTFQ